MNLSSEWIYGYIGGCVLGLGLDNESLDILPMKIVIRVTFLLFLLGFIVLKEQYTNEKVKQEEGTNQNESNEVNHVSVRVTVLWTLVFSYQVQSLEHNIWPSFKT